MPKKSALLLGGSGLIGGHCLEYLLGDAYYSQVDVLVRRPLMMDHPKLRQHQVSFEQLNDHASKIQANDIYCCLGTIIKKAGSQSAFYEVDFTYPTEAAKLSFANGAERFLLVSALGANAGSKIFYNRVKGEVEEAIAEFGFQGFFIFQPSLLLGERQEKRPWEAYGQKAYQWFSFAFKGKLKQYRAIEAKAVAYAMVTVAKEQRQGKHVFKSHDIQSIYDQERD